MALCVNNSNLSSMATIWESAEKAPSKKYLKVSRSCKTAIIFVYLSCLSLKVIKNREQVIFSLAFSKQ